MIDVNSGVPRPAASPRGSATVPLDGADIRSQVVCQSLAFHVGTRLDDAIRLVLTSLRAVAGTVHLGPFGNGMLSGEECTKREDGSHNRGTLVVKSPDGVSCSNYSMCALYHPLVQEQQTT